VIYTFNNSLLTLVSQSFGQRDMMLCATYLNRQIILTVAMYIPQFMILFLYTEKVFLAAGIDPVIA
jgi:hypothetical protein